MFARLMAQKLSGKRERSSTSRTSAGPAVISVRRGHHRQHRTATRCWSMAPISSSIPPSIRTSPTIAQGLRSGHHSRDRAGDPHGPSVGSCQDGQRSGCAHQGNAGKYSCYASPGTGTAPSGGRVVPALPGLDLVHALQRRRVAFHSRFQRARLWHDSSDRAAVSVVGRGRTGQRCSTDDSVIHWLKWIAVAVAPNMSPG